MLIVASIKATLRAIHGPHERGGGVGDEGGDGGAGGGVIVGITQVYGCSFGDGLVRSSAFRRSSPEPPKGRNYEPNRVRLLTTQSIIGERTPHRNRSGVTAAEPVQRRESLLR